MKRRLWLLHPSSMVCPWPSRFFNTPGCFSRTRRSASTIRQHLLDSIKVAAMVRDAPCQSVAKVWRKKKLHSH